MVWKEVPLDTKLFSTTQGFSPIHPAQEKNGEEKDIGSKRESTEINSIGA